MSVAEYLKAVRRYWVVILVLSLLGGLTGYLYAQRLPVRYGSQSSVIVIPGRGDTTVELVQGSNYVQNLVQTYATLATAPVVLDPVIESLGLDETAGQLKDRVTVTAPLNTVIIDIFVVDATPQGAQLVADAIATSLAAVVDSLSPSGSDGQRAVRLQTIAPASLNPAPVSPNVRLMIVLGLVAGLAIGVIGAVLRTVFAARLTRGSDIEERTETPVLSEVPAMADRATLLSSVLTAPTGRAAESLRSVVAALRFVGVERRQRILLVTSPSPAEGKTSISLALAVVLAELGNRVLYVEADLRRPSAENQTQSTSAVGLTTVLLGDLPIEEAVQAWGPPGLDLLLCGEIPPNPIQLLSGDRVKEVFAQALENYDYVIVDSAPVLPVSDSRWLTSSVDGVLMVARMNKTRWKSLSRALDLLSVSPAPILGVIANSTRDGSSSPYYSSEQKRRRWRGWSLRQPPPDTEQAASHGTARPPSTRERGASGARR